jgi:hypothetical protein
MLKITHTRYSAGNVALLIAGGLICCVSVFLSVMTAGFGADPAHDFRSFAFTAYLLLSLLLAPIYLMMFRWCSVGAIAMWWLFGVCLITLLAGLFFQQLGFMVPLLIEAIIFDAINSRSCTESSSEGDLG